MPYYLDRQRHPGDRWIKGSNNRCRLLSEKQKLLLREYINSVADKTSLVSLVRNESREVAKSIMSHVRRVTDAVTTIKLEEVVKQLKGLHEVSVVKSNHLTALMIGYEIEKQLKENLQ